MKIRISNEVTIFSPAFEILDYCKRELVIDNPEFIKKQKLGKWIGNTPRKLSLYKLNGKDVIVPIGALRDILSIVKLHKIPVETDISLSDNKKIDYNADIKLYDYQEVAVKELIDKGFGILLSKPGSGKTQMGIALIARLGVKALWLTHTHDLLKQSYDRAARYIDKKLLAKITDGKVEICEGITFATIQTLAKQDMEKYKYEWDLVIVDECHRCAGAPTASTRFSKVISSLATRHKYGLSATLHRSDGMIKTTTMLLGGAAYRVPDEAIADKVMQVNIKKVELPAWEIPDECLDTDGTIKYSTLISSLCNINKRNEIIRDNIMSGQEHYHLILSDRIEHLEKIYALLPDNLKAQSALVSGKMTSKKGKEDRAKAINDMQEGRKHFLFASYSLAKEGLDIQRLDRLHLATPQKDYAVVTQSLGRIARTFEGKKEPICYDYVDDVGIFCGMYKKRCTIYRKAGCKIC